MTAPSPTEVASGTLVRHLEPVMGTIVTLEVLETSAHAPRDRVRALARARRELHRADAIFSLWRPHSPMSRLRRGELEATLPEIDEVLDLCEVARDWTNGYFDAAAIPGGLDPTGLVKGWAAARALAALTAHGYEHALVNAAGDIAVAGRAPLGHPWRIGIEHPLRRGAIAATVEIDAAIATSGTAQRGAHLYNPRSHRYESALASASVTGPDLALADALATALCVAGLEGLEFLEARPDYAALAITASGELVPSSRWDKGPCSTPPPAAGRDGASSSARGGLTASAPNRSRPR